MKSHVAVLLVGVGLLSMGARGVVGLLDAADPTPLEVALATEDQNDIRAIMLSAWRAVAQREEANKEMLATPAGVRYLNAVDNVAVANHVLFDAQTRLGGKYKCAGCRINDDGTKLLMPAPDKVTVKPNGE